MIIQKKFLLVVGQENIPKWLSGFCNLWKAFKNSWCKLCWSGNKINEIFNEIDLVKFIWLIVSSRNSSAKISSCLHESGIANAIDRFCEFDCLLSVKIYWIVLEINNRIESLKSSSFMIVVGNDQLINKIFWQFKSPPVVSVRNGIEFCLFDDCFSMISPARSIRLSFKPYVVDGIIIIST